MKLEAFKWEALSEPIVIGVDEVGRGCLAGPVYSACAIVNTESPYSHFRDSKSLSPEKRKSMAIEIEEFHQVALGEASVQEIDKLNILGAALLSMKRAFLALNIPRDLWKSCHLLVDGNIPVPGLESLKQTCLVKGDQRATPIAMASIFAKVKRDEKLIELSQTYPVYGFEQHKAYGTKAHKEAIARFGPCPEHRRSFAGVREYC